MTPFVGEVRIFAALFAPAGWLTCDGQTLRISSYTDLFNAIGTTYGGDGTTTFALPDLRRGAPIHSGAGYHLGQSGGANTVALAAAELPVHTHDCFGDTVVATTTTNDPSNALYGNGAAFYVANPHASNIRPMTAALPPWGNSTPHDNMQPYLVVTYIIATNGIPPGER